MLWYGDGSYLHYIHRHPLRGNTLHIVDQPMNHLSTDETVDGKPLLLWEQLYACAVIPEGTDTDLTSLRPKFQVS